MAPERLPKACCLVVEVGVAVLVARDLQGHLRQAARRSVSVQPRVAVQIDSPHPIPVLDTVGQRQDAGIETVREDRHRRRLAPVLLGPPLRPDLELRGVGGDRAVDEGRFDAPPVGLPRGQAEVLEFRGEEVLDDVRAGRQEAALGVVAGQLAQVDVDRGDALVVRNADRRQVPRMPLRQPGPVVGEQAVAGAEGAEEEAQPGNPVRGGEVHLVLRLGQGVCTREARAVDSHDAVAVHDGNGERLGQFVVAQRQRGRLVKVDRLAQILAGAACGQGRLEQHGDGILEHRLDQFRPVAGFLVAVLPHQGVRQQLRAVGGHRQLVEHRPLDRGRGAPEHRVGEGVADDADLAANLLVGKVAERPEHFPLGHVPVGDEGPLAIGRDGHPGGALDVLQEPGLRVVGWRQPRPADHLGLQRAIDALDDDRGEAPVVAPRAQHELADGRAGGDVQGMLTCLAARGIEVQDGDIVGEDRLIRHDKVSELGAGLPDGLQVQHVGVALGPPGRAEPAAALHRRREGEIAPPADRHVEDPLRSDLHHR